MPHVALKGAVCCRPSSSSSPFRRLFGSEAVLLPMPLDSVDDAALTSHQEHFIRLEPDLPPDVSSSKVRANDLRRILEEQREIFIELQNQLKDQRELLRLICEELYFSKSQLKTQELIINAVRVPLQTNAESVSGAASKLCEKNAEEVQFARTALCGRGSENGKTVVLFENSTNGGDSILNKGLDADKFQHPLWPEWKLFLDCLRPHASAKDGKPQDERCELFDDTSLLKHALVKFAQAHKAAFRTLSRKDLIMLVQHELPSMDEKTAVGKKKLRNYLVMDECEVTEPKLTDVVRLIYRAVRSVPLLGGDLSDDLKSAIIHILKDLVRASITKHDSSSRTMEGHDQKIAKGLEIEISNNATDIVAREAVLPTRSPSMNQDEATSTTSASLELPEFSSLKERVDTRRARLEKERMVKGAAKTVLPQPLLTRESEQKTLSKCSTQMDKSRDNVVRNFKAFDSIIESEDSDSCETSNSQSKGVSTASLSSLVPKKGSTLFLQNKGAQHRNRQPRKNGGGRAAGGF